MKKLGKALLITLGLIIGLVAIVKGQAFHKNQSRVVLVTGAASGIGKATAARFAEEGYTVYATDINTSNWGTLANSCKTLYLDVTDEASIQKAFETINRETDGVDILVNNAGYGQNGVIEELTLDQIRRQFEVNVFGLVRVAQMVMPSMREKGKGLIINISSVGGDFTTPGASAYHATKYAVESFTDGMRAELAPFGINVVAIKPSGVDTNFDETMLELTPKSEPSSPYAEFNRKALVLFSTVLDPSISTYPILEATDVSDVIYKAATKKNPKTRYKVGSTAKLVPVVKSLRSDKGFDRMMMNQLDNYYKKMKKRNPELVAQIEGD